MIGSPAITSVLPVILPELRPLELAFLKLHCMFNLKTRAETRAPRPAFHLPIGYLSTAVERSHPRSSQKARHRAEECRRRGGQSLQTGPVGPDCVDVIVIFTKAREGDQVALW